ncbi:MAG: Gfo/Idh/MocA family oxidoreductase [Oscillospiraceae bacterium]|nr:Gfo/Idh/MocA family oxidoreductase [Oscillospiraceae bacterium]
MKSPSAMKRAFGTLRNKKCASLHILRSKMLHSGKAAASYERKRVLHYFLLLPSSLLPQPTLLAGFLGSNKYCGFSTNYKCKVYTLLFLFYGGIINKNSAKEWELMKTAGLIGLGKITRHYAEGLDSSSFLNLCAVSDINPNSVSRELYSSLPFFADYKDMISSAKPDFAIISTPPESHFEIAKFCLENNTNVIIEKPVVLNIADFDALCGLAKEKALKFITLFHWQGGIELDSFNSVYNPEDIKEINVFVSDPYSDDGKSINTSVRALMGAWIDSGVNALSMIKMWLPFKSLEIIKTNSVKCTKTDLPLYASAELLIDKVRVSISVDWRSHKTLKESYITLSDKKVYINHSEQSLSDNTGSVSLAKRERMTEHYYNLFTRLDGRENTESARLIHKFLLEVNDAL